MTVRIPEWSLYALYFIGVLAGFFLREVAGLFERRRYKHDHRWVVPKWARGKELIL